MIDREDFEDYLRRHRGCELVQQRDLTVRRRVGGAVYHASFGDHSRRQVHSGQARRLLLDLHFTDSEIRDIMSHF